MEPSEFQKKIAEKLSVDISGMKLFSAGAKIEEAIFLAIHPESKSKPATERQKNFATSLGIKCSETDSMLLVSAKIEEFLLERNTKLLEKLKLGTGDTVTVNHQHKDTTWTTEHVVSSIAKNARIFFKGIGCKGAWPTEVVAVKKVK